MQDIAIYGAGGFGKEVACILNKINQVDPEWNFIGFFDDGLIKGTSISHFGQVLGGSTDINLWPTQIAIAFAIGNPRIIETLVDKINNVRVSYPNIIHPDVFFADPISFKIGRGNVIVRGCTFSVDVSIGDFNQINSISSLAHDVVMGSFNVLMPLTRVSGEVQIGNYNIFGLNTLILQQIKIGNQVRTGPGAVLMTKPKDGVLYMGNPAKKTIL
jgi:sugar O-acyltransferase (sialic acid O-acetyltransferase NeuD family)